MHKINLLLTCIGGRFSAGTIEALRRDKDLNIRIIGTDANSQAKTKYLVDTFYNVPFGDSNEYIDTILDICKKEDIEIVIPCSDEEVISISKARDIFINRGITAAVEGLDKISILTDKGLLFAHLSKIGIPVPTHKIVKTEEDIREAARLLGYPEKRFVIKPTRSRGARGVWVVGEDSSSTPLNSVIDGIKKIYQENFSLLAVEYLDGPAFDVDVLANNGAPICIIPRKRLWKNPLSASNEGCRVEDNASLVSYVSSIVDLFKMNYAYDFDCGISSEERAGIYEINPRLSGSVASTLGAGVNIPCLLVRLLKGLSIPKIEIKFGISMFPANSTLSSVTGWKRQ